MTETEKIQNEIKATRLAQSKIPWTNRGNNAARFGAYERKLEALYRQLDALRK